MRGKRLHTLLCLCRAATLWPRAQKQLNVEPPPCQGGGYGQVAARPHYTTSPDPSFVRREAFDGRFTGKEIGSPCREATARSQTLPSTIPHRQGFAAVWASWRHAKQSKLESSSTHGCTSGAARLQPVQSCVALGKRSWICSTAARSIVRNTGSILSSLLRSVSDELDHGAERQRNLATH